MHFTLLLLLSIPPYRRETCKYNWERTRSLIGSRWAWLHHRLTTLNKDLCRLEHEIQRRPTKERFSFARPDPSHPPSWFALPSNGSLLEQLNRTSGNGSTTPLLSAAMSNLQQKGSGNKTSIKPSNGYTTDHAAATAAPANAGNGPPKTHAHYYPQLLLSEANIGSKLQVCVSVCVSVCVCVCVLGSEGGGVLNCWLIFINNYNVSHSTS